MLLPRIAIFTGPLEFRTFASFARTIELRPLAERAITLGTITLGTILARARKPRTLIAAAILTRLVVARLVEISRAVT